jgi:Tol biopolymer transport system component/tRNA A-37 threonylcarbamoyl transferase component Bud32
MPDDLIGKAIGGYEILEVIGRGGMATVYRAQQVSMNRLVALKVLPQQYVQDDTYIQRFHQEAKIVAQLEHRNIVPVYDYGEYNGQPYLVMRYLNGGSVDDLLAKGPLELENIISIIEQVAPALDYAHSKNVLHRDLKPSNILLDDDGGAYLTDFGIARILGQQSAGITTQGVVGTPSYMSPEQAQGLPLDNRSDIYSLGVMLFEMATGRRPFENDTPYSIAVMQVTTPPPQPRSYNPGIPLAVEEVILKSMRKKREERYPNAVSLAEALKRAANKPVMSIHDTQPGFPRPAPRPAPPPVQHTPPPPQPMQQSVPVQQSPPPMYAVPVSSPSMAPAYVRRKRKTRSGGVWMSAAVGALIGCGLLTMVVIILIIVVNSVTNSKPPATSAPTAPFSTLDPTSDTVRQTLVPGGSSSGPVNSVKAACDPTIEGIASAGIAPVGVRIDPNLAQSGRALVYSAKRDGNFDIFRLDLDTGIETRLTNDPSTDSYPAVSPDGQCIAFQSGRDGDFEIFIMNISGGDVRQLTSNAVWDRLPAWSPDGSKIVYSSDTRQDGKLDLYTMNADGSDQKIVLNNGARNSAARWSRDGLSMVFSTGPDDKEENWEVGSLDLNSGSTTQLTSAGSGGNWGPDYSPDGKKIIYTTFDPGCPKSLCGEATPARYRGKSALARMNPDGSGQEVVFDDDGYEWGASYSPDGQYITFTSDVSGVQQIYVMRADGTDVQQLTSDGGQYASWVPK